MEANLFNGGVRADGTPTITRGGAPIGGRFFGYSSFAAHAVADERSVVKVDSDVPLELVAPLGCGVQTGAGTVLNILKPAAGSTLAVFGTGAVGLSAIAAAALNPLSEVIAVDRVESRLTLAKELGATRTINAATDDVAAALADITGGAGLDHAIDTTANMGVIRTAVEALSTFGSAAVVGAAPMGTEINLDYMSLLVGRSVIGVTEGDSDRRPSSRSWSTSTGRDGSRWTRSSSPTRSRTSTRRRPTPATVRRSSRFSCSTTAESTAPPRTVTQNRSSRPTSLEGS